MRAVKGLDMVQIQGRGPLVSFTTDAQGGVPPTLAFVKLLGVYDITRVQVRPGQ